MMRNKRLKNRLGQLPALALLLLASVPLVYAQSGSLIERKTESKANPLVQPEKKPIREKVIYLKEIWRSLGSKYNVILARNTWRIMDNYGETIFSRARKNKDKNVQEWLFYSNENFFVATQSYSPLQRKLTLLDKKGMEKTALLTGTHAPGSIVVVGSTLVGSGPRISAFPDGIACNLHQVTAFSLTTGKKLEGDLPSHISMLMKPIFRPDWDRFYLLTDGDWEAKEKRIKLLEFDKNLKQTFSHPIARTNHRLAFACTDKSTIYMASSAPNLYWDLLYYDVNTRKLASAPMPLQARWINGMSAGEGKLVIWCDGQIMLYEPRKAQTKRWKIVTTRLRYHQSLNAMSEDGRFALVERPERNDVSENLLIYSPAGKLLEKIQIKRGITSMKFVSGGKELLVFGRDYTARVKLEPLPMAVTRCEKCKDKPLTKKAINCIRCKKAIFHPQQFCPGCAKSSSRCEVCLTRIDDMGKPVKAPAKPAFKPTTPKAKGKSK